MSEALMESETGQIELEDELMTWRFSRRFTLGQIPFMSVKRMMCGAARISVPTLIIHGEGDTQNHPDGSRQLYENLTVLQKKLVMIPDMDHDLDGLGLYIGAGAQKAAAP